MNAIRIFNEKEVDELIVLDITASRNGTNPDFALIEEFASECFMPLCYGGGIRTIEDVRRLFASGVEKVSLQTAILDDLSLVERVSEEYGSQSVVVSMDVKKTMFRGYQLHRTTEGKADGRSIVEFRDAATAAGAGEILVNSIDRDGTLSGMDTTLIEKCAEGCDVPVIALGGAARISDLRAAIDAGASAVAAGAMFVFHGPLRAVLITYPDYSELELRLDS